MSIFALYAPHLRRLGFKKQWSSRAGGERCDQWVKHEFRPEPKAGEGGFRILHVQLWAEGLCKVSHEIRNGYHGKETTYPTEFHDLETLERAVEHEKTRQDAEPLHGVTL